MGYFNIYGEQMMTLLHSFNSFLQKDDIFRNLNVFVMM